MSDTYPLELDLAHSDAGASKYIPVKKIMDVAWWTLGGFVDPGLSLSAQFGGAEVQGLSCGLDSIGLTTTP